MIFTLPQSVRATLSWLEWTEADEELIDRMIAYSRMMLRYGGDEDVFAALRKCWQTLEESSLKPPTKDWSEFVRGKIASPEDFRLLLSDDSPLQKLTSEELKSPTDRFRYLMIKVIRMEGLAPLAMRKLWVEALERHDGDPLAAEISLEFLRPAVSR